MSDAQSFISHTDDLKKSSLSPRGRSLDAATLAHCLSGQSQESNSLCVRTTQSVMLRRIDSFGTFVGNPSLYHSVSQSIVFTKHYRSQVNRASMPRQCQIVCHTLTQFTMPGCGNPNCTLCCLCTRVPQLRERPSATSRHQMSNTIPLQSLAAATAPRPWPFSTRSNGHSLNTA